MPTVIKGQPTSGEVIERLKSEGKPVILACSLGKDSLAAWCALEEAGVEVIPVHFWTVPGLKFVDDSVEKMERLFGTEIHLEPHPRFIWMLEHLVAQPPQRVSTIQYANLAALSYDDMWPLIKRDLDLPADTYVCDGVRACDSLPRRASLTKHGVIKPSKHTASVIADWTKAEVMAALKNRGVGLPPDYEIFGRSFDGIDRRFVEPLRQAFPEDYERLKKWFPLIDTDIDRWAHFDMTTKKADGDEPNSARSRIRTENNRYKLAVTDDYWVALSFSSEDKKQAFESLFSEKSENGHVFTDSCTAPIPQTRMRKIKRRSIRLNPPAKAPIDNFRASDGTLNDDALAIGESLLDAFEAVDNMSDASNVFGSGIYSVVIGRDESDINAFTAQYHIPAGVHMPYTDGDKALEKMAV